MVVTLTTSPEAPGLTRCAGAFGRVCLMATRAVLCNGCWAIIERAFEHVEAGRHYWLGLRLTARGWAVAERREEVW